MTKSIVDALGKLQAVAIYEDPKFDFIKNYAYDLGLDDLLKYGGHQYVISSRQLALCLQMFTLLPRLGPTLLERKLSSAIGI